ncbi:hypothetical protein G7054_g139 [Neopestalotiopsis clavispora]|nr:hypothetical protein G7054_g139 [Neopestalotiopsis clavispora]
MATHDNADNPQESDADDVAQSDDETNKSDDISTSDTVPRSRYEQLLRRLGALEEKITKFDDSIQNKDLNSDDDQYPGDIEGPWLDHKSLHDIRFMIRSARSVRKKQKAQIASMDASEATREEATQSHLKSDGDRGLSAAQLLQEGTRVKPDYSLWKEFRSKTDRLSQPKSFLEPIHVLLGEPKPNLPMYFNGQRVPKEEEEEDYSQRISNEMQKGRLPERIHICSLTLLTALDRAFGSPQGSGVNGAVFLRPFKALVYFDDELRKTQSNLRESISERIRAGVSVLPWEDPQALGRVQGGDLERGSWELARREIGPKINSDADQKRNDLLKDCATVIQMDCLFEFFDARIKPKLHEFKDNNYDAEIAFDELWNLFKPGDLVMEQGEKQAYRLIQVITPVHRGTSPWARWFKDKKAANSNSGSDSEDEADEDPLRLECVFLDYDGVQFGPVSKTFKISRYEGKRPIKLLPVYGIRFSTNPKIRQQLVQRGKMFFDVATYKSMYYTGFSLNTNEEVDSQVVVDFAEALSVSENKSWKPKITPASTGNKRKARLPCTESCCSGRIVHNDDYVDRKLVETFMETLMPQQTDKPPLTIHPKSWVEMKKEGYNPSDDDFLIMTYRVFAFVLRSRKWDGHKEMVQALVTQHFQGRIIAPTGGAQPDLIRGKGKGLIILLHGAPGVGKTTTAGDLGTTPIEVQTELEKNFSLASRWGCVLLLDEADVFLAQRERKDLTRNALVAIFLRILEYYTGILFLTTNRVGDFDEAFASRIHMSLHYPALNAVKTKKVFELNLDLIKDRMKQQDRHFTIDEDAILDFAEMHYKEHEYGRWNGRQIRNACQTALALAEFESEKDTVFLKPRHFKKVQEAYLDFARYLGETFGTHGDQRAYENQLRAEEPKPFTESEASIARAERNTQPSRTRPSAFRPTAQPQAAPMQPSQQMYAAYSDLQIPQEGQYLPPNHPPRAPMSQSGTNAARQYGHQGQPWTGQSTMHQPLGQYPYQQPPQPQPSYQQQGFVAQSHDQTGDGGIDDGTNPGTRAVNF